MPAFHTALHPCCLPPWQETRYRQRYLDLMMNPGIQDIFRVRSRIIAGVRSYLDNRGFMEVGGRRGPGTRGGGSQGEPSLGRRCRRLHACAPSRSTPVINTGS